MRAFINIGRRGILVFAAIMIAFGGTGLPALAADTFQVSGTITNQNGTGVQNVAVTATNPGTTTVVAGPVSSAANGAYQLSVAPGTYDLHYLPQSGSSLSELIQTNVEVTANRTVSVQLTPASEQHTFSGVLTDYHGNPASGIQVRLNGNTVMAADSAGHFSGTFVAAEYEVSIRKDSLDLPEYPYFWLPYGTVDLTNADVIHNYQLPPVFTLSVTALQYNGTPVANQIVRLETDPYNPTEVATAFTNAQGVAQVPIIKDVAIPAGSVCTTFNPGNAKVCNTDPIAATGNANITLTAPDLNLRTVSGRVTDAQGNGVASLDVMLKNGPAEAWAKTNPEGNYTVTTIGGVYDMQLMKDDSGIALEFPYFTMATGQVDSSTADITKNVQLPAVKNLTVTFTQPNGAPINAPVNYWVGDRFQPGHESWRVQTNSAGQAVLPVMEGITLPAGSICGFAFGDNYCHQSAVPVTQDVSVALAGPATRTFSGTLKDANGVAVKNTQVLIGGTGTTTTKTGFFSVTVKAGVHELKFRNDTTQAGLPFFTLPFGTVDLTENNVQANYNLPRLYNLAVTVKDVDGNPLSQHVDITSPENFNHRLTTNGVANLPVFENTTIGTGELCTTFQVEWTTVCNATPIAITGDATFVFQQSPAPVKPDAPANLWGIVDVNGDPVLSWDVVTGAAHYIVYRDGEMLATVPDTSNEYHDLAAEPGEHTYYVVAVSPSGGVSDPSPSVTLNVANGDTTPPTVSSFTLPSKPANQTMSFTVGATDEGSGVAGGEFFYGADPGVGNGTTMTYANGNLNGMLTNTMPAGVYQVSVRAQDNAGNWSDTKSATIVVTASVNRAQGQTSFKPSAGTDVLPNMSSATIFNNAQANLNVRQQNGGIASTSAFTFTYNTGSFLCTFFPGLSGCHTFTVNMANASTFQLYGTNYSKARIVGAAQVTVDGVTSVRPFVAEIVDGNRVNGSTQDSYELRMYPVGADVNSAAAEWHVTKTVSRSSMTIQ